MMKKVTAKVLSIVFFLSVMMNEIALPVSAAEKRFTDVSEDAYYWDAVLWALDSGVTTGTSATTFSPSMTCTRGQVVTFLWRAQGEPEPEMVQNIFLDVNSSDYFYKPVLWAVEQGITNGTSASAFSPEMTCTRAQVITFLWRAEGEPDVDEISDLAASCNGQYYQDAVAWADVCGMLSDMGGPFDASSDCPRSDIVTYLYRFSTGVGGSASNEKRLDTTIPSSFHYSDVPEYSGEPFVQMNGNVPYFSTSYLTTESYELYSDLDALGRCGTAVACVGRDIMPTEERGAIGQVKPTGWHLVKYDCVDGKYLYNRCHLLGYQLTGENSNAKNLITGTRHLNVVGMLPFEDLIAEYVEDTGNHVLYRVTPVFEGSNLLASGVLMEGMSCEDHGASVQFCVFCYNVQPGIIIDYSTGDSYESGEVVVTPPEETSGGGSAILPEENTGTTPEGAQIKYVLNMNTHKFHIPTCSSVKKISAKNRLDYSGTRESVLQMGYVPCKICNP